MNLLHVTPYLGPAWAFGGVPWAVASLARAQVAAGHQVVVLTTDAMAPHERLPTGDTYVDGVRVIRVRNISGAVRMWLNLSTPIGLRAPARALFQSQPIDVVHLHELRTVENLLVVAEAPPTVPVVLSPHGTIGPGTGAVLAWATRAWDGSLGKGLLARVDQLVASCAAEARELVALYSDRGLPLHQAAVTVVPDGVELSAFADVPDRAPALARFDLGNGPVVLFLGQLSERNGLSLLVSAFSEVVARVPRAQLLVAGPDHGVLADTRAQVRARGLDASVRFAGYLTGRDVRAAFAAADLFARPALADGFPRAALEALASGVPVLLSAGCAFPEAAAAGAGCTLANETKAWADVMGSLLAAPGPLEAMRGRTRRLAARYAWPAVAATLDDVYARARRGQPA